ncbi:MAG TPA: amidohydrolase [Symbiobacteriaceae bacterium]|jgi:amidohydrolase
MKTSQVMTLADSLGPRLTEIRRELHRHPELSGEEVWTTGRLREWLTAAGIEILPLPLTTGLVAEIKGAQPGPVIALRTDIDALPVQEETGLPYASGVPGKMHACGHDFHMSVILGAALVLKTLAGEFAGTVRILCQPAEETALGAIQFIQVGALDGVQAVFGLHNKPDLPAGHVGIKAGPLMAAVDTITITVTGRGGHAAIPDAAVDPIVAGSAIVMALQTIVSRNVSPLDSAVVTISAFQAGAAHNVIPPSATLLGTVRTSDPAVRARMPELLGRVAGQVAAGYGAAAQLRFDDGTPPVVNHPAMAEVVRRAAGGLSMPVVEAVPTMGGEDFAEYLQHVPGCFIWLGTGCPEGWHHPRFMVDESVIPKGAALFASAALEALSLCK